MRGASKNDAIEREERANTKQNKRADDQIFLNMNQRELDMYVSKLKRQKHVYEDKSAQLRVGKEKERKKRRK